jgi:cytochrome P450
MTLSAAAPSPDSSPGSSSDRPVFDPFDPSWSSNPFPLYADLRRRSPIHRNEMGFWVLSRHADCLAVLREKRASSDTLNMDQGGMPEEFRRPVEPDSPEAVGLAAMRPLLFRDPPDHTRLRGLVVKAFTPKVVDALRPRIQQVIDELLDTALEENQVDLLEEFAYQLPVRIICDMLGVPVEDQHRFRAWSQALARGLDPDFLLTDDIIEARGVAALEIIRYFAELMDEHRRNPCEDLLSALIEVEDGGTTLSQPELLSTTIFLLGAGHETTVNLISGGILALLRNPDQLQRFLNEPETRRGSVDEMLRYVSPVQLTTRAFTEDCEIGGSKFEAGDFAMLLIASANRDEDEFENAGEFQIDRSPNNHLSLGFGIHHCIGGALARIQTHMAIESLFERAPKLAVDGDIVYKSNVILRGMEALPVSMRG